MVGAPPSDELSNLAASIPQPGKVRFLQGLTTEQINASYSSARVLLFPSLEEGFGWPIVEAMASGCPVITTNIAPMTEIASKTTRLIPRMPSNIAERQAWAKAAAGILAEMVGLNGSDRENVVREGISNARRFGADTAIDDYEKIYLRVMQN